MFSAEFMRNALLAGTFIALACGVSGWFVVLRGQVFAGRAVTPAEIDELAKLLIPEFGQVSITAEERH